MGLSPTNDITLKKNSTGHLEFFEVGLTPPSFHETMLMLTSLRKELPTPPPRVLQTHTFCDDFESRGCVGWSGWREQSHHHMRAWLPTPAWMISGQCS